MFKQARIKLTAWYLLIIMLISVSFSVVIFRIMTIELNRFEQMERVRIERRFPQPPLFIDPAAISEIKQRLLMRLAVINMFILAGSALAGYFLAGRTLKPIAEMLDEQNRFITDASHELRTPLTALRSEIEVSLRNKRITLGDAKKLLLSNLEETDRLQNLSDGLIKLAQYQTGINGFPLTGVSLKHVLTEAVKAVHRTAQNKRITITNAAGSHTIRGNQQALTELFIILLDNAIKYSPKGKMIRMTSMKKDMHVLVQVQDQGVGVAKEDIPHIFDRFYRADKSRTKFTIDGYGLGLAIAKEIVERHKGVITVESTPNKGSTFSVELPA